MTNPRDAASLNEVLDKCELLVNKDGFYNTFSLNISPLQNDKGNIRLLKIEILGEPIGSDFFSFVLNALGNLNSIFGYILQSYENELHLYVGLKTSGDMRTALDILENGLTSSYSGSKFRELSLKESRLILSELFNPSIYRALSAAVVIPNNVSSNSAPINQKLVDLMGKEEFTAIFLAIPKARSEVKCLINELKELYTMLSAFSQTDYEFSKSISKNTAVHITDSITDSTGSSCADTNSIENACSASKYILIAPSTAIPLENLPAFNISLGFNKTYGVVTLTNKTETKGETAGYAVAKIKLHINSGTHTNNDSISFNSQNKKVTDMLDKLAELISRLNAVLEDAVFCFGAYFFSKSEAASIRAAYTYLGLARDKGINIGENHVVTWEKDEDTFQRLIQEIKHFNHLSFSSHSKNEYITTSQLISSHELLNTFYFPYSKGL